MLPTDFQGALAVVHKLEGELEAAMRGPFRSRAEVNAANAKCIPINKNLELARNNFHAIQQGNKAVSFNADHQAAVVTGQRARPSRLADELAKMLAFKESKLVPAFPKPRQVSNPLALAPFERLMAELWFQTGASVFIARFADYRIAVLQADINGLLNPQDTLGQVYGWILANSTDLDEIKSIKDQITAISGSDARQ